MMVPAPEVVVKANILEFRNFLYFVELCMMDETNATQYQNAKYTQLIQQIDNLVAATASC